MTSEKRRYVSAVTTGAALTSLILIVFLVLLVMFSDSGEQGIYFASAMVLLIPLLIVAGVTSYFSAFLSASIVYIINPQSTIGKSKKYGITTGVILVPALILVFVGFKQIGEFHSTLLKEIAVFLVLSVVLGASLCLGLKQKPGILRRQSQQ